MRALARVGGAAQRRPRTHVGAPGWRSPFEQRPMHDEAFDCRDCGHLHHADPQDVAGMATWSGRGYVYVTVMPSCQVIFWTVCAADLRTSQQCTRHRKTASLAWIAKSWSCDEALFPGRTECTRGWRHRDRDLEPRQSTWFCQGRRFVVTHGESAAVHPLFRFALQFVS